MSREIKFSYLYQHGETGQWTDIKKSLEAIEAGGIHLHSSWKLIARRQFTGLTDKNGKEIYEADVVSQYTVPDCVVEWNVNGHWHFKRVTTGATYSVNHWETEVIGNRFEDPDFLEVAS